MTHTQDAGTPAMRVLIVDDSVDTARMLRLLLKAEGYAAAIAHDGPEAVRAAAELKPTVVLLDLTLPGMSGVEVAETLRRDPAHADCRIVAVSGYGRDQLPLPSPFGHHLTKPVDHERLIRLLDGFRAGEKPAPAPLPPSITATA